MCKAILMNKVSGFWSISRTKASNGSSSPPRRQSARDCQPSCPFTVKSLLSSKLARSSSAIAGQSRFFTNVRACFVLFCFLFVFLVFFGVFLFVCFGDENSSSSSFLTAKVPRLPATSSIRALPQKLTSMMASIAQTKVSRTRKPRARFWSPPKHHQPGASLHPLWHVYTDSNSPSPFFPLFSSFEDGFQVEEMATILPPDPSFF